MSGWRRSSRSQRGRGIGATYKCSESAWIEAVPHLLAGHVPALSLLHGDLWGGNAGFLEDGTPVVLIWRSTTATSKRDLAMTELFGGFPAGFYEGYREVRPIDEEGYRRRRELYNLYHVFNHLNLFGGQLSVRRPSG